MLVSASGQCKTEGHSSPSFSSLGCVRPLLCSGSNRSRTFFIRQIFRLYSSPPSLRFDWHSSAGEEMRVKGQHHPTAGPACLPRAASGHVLSPAKDQGCETRNTPRSPPLPAAGRRLASDRDRTEHKFTERSLYFSSAISASICLLHSAPSVDRDERSLPGNCGTARAAPFLVSKQVVLFSILVSKETAIICPLKRSHAQTRTANTSAAALQKAGQRNS